MDRAEAGRIGGLVTSARYGTEEIRCPMDGALCEKRTHFHSENGRKGGKAGGKKGMRVMRARHSEEERREWCRKGGRRG